MLVALQCLGGLQMQNLHATCGQPYINSLRFGRQSLGNLFHIVATIMQSYENKDKFAWRHKNNQKLPGMLLLLPGKSFHTRYDLLQSHETVPLNGLKPDISYYCEFHRQFEV